MTAHPQTIASNPAISAFVSANAGSGKTSTLVSRVARLLLAGARPDTLLCVTYTKAAAAEMQRRLFERLGAWAVADDAALRTELARLEAGDPGAYDHHHLSRARALFAGALETPGGLKIQTIHAFCEKLLRRFPIEAGISPGFEVADDAAAADLAAEARAAVAKLAMREENALLSEAYDRFSVALAFDDFQEMFRTFEYRRGDIARWLGSIGGARALVTAVPGMVGLEALVDPDEVEREAILAIDQDGWLAAAAALDEGSDTDRKRADCMRAAVAALRDGEVPLDLVCKALFTAERKPLARVATKAVAPGAAFWLGEEQFRLAAAFERARAARIAGDTIHAMTLAGFYVSEYETAKKKRRLLDFADLVAHTHALLTETADAAWVLYKLDEGIDHILIDEAQDTAPEQWAVIRELTEAFFGGGAGGRDAPAGRSVFVVGDEKQSIFSFQGARPERLRQEAAHYRERVMAAGLGWEDVPLVDSWRSTPEVLKFVDAVFAPPDNRAGLLPRDLDPQEAVVEHVARRLNDPGCVDLWPMEREEPAEEQDAWTEPLDSRGHGAWRRLADRIASEVRRILDTGEMVHDRSRKGEPWRPANAGDVLILVRKRGALFEETIRALKRAGVPVAGADRLVLSEHPVFADALALARFVLFPDDDLTLAGLLRSPFCDVDEDSLFALARDRKGSLWRMLKARADERPEWRSALDLLDAARREAPARTPFDFFSRLYARLDGEGRSQRTRAVTRLGPETADALDELLAQVLAAEQRGARDLEAVAHALGRLDITVKREMDEPKGEARVMTAHGAKGLEAPIVFLPETVQAGEPRGSSLLELESGGFLWCASGKADCEATRAARALRKQKGEDESLRLLYVGLTRARDRVIIAGRAKQPPKTKAEELKGWYPLVEAAFAHPDVASHTRKLVLNGMEITRFGHDPARGVEADGTAGAAPSLPPWARTPAPPEGRVARWVSPSQMAEEQAKAPAPSPLAERGGLGRFRRGELIHKLFEILPDLPPDGRRAAARALMAREPGLTGDQRAEMIEATFGVLEDDRFAEVFGPHSRAEVAVAGGAPDLPPGLAISGRLDRLLVTADRVLVVDYKTNRPAPDRAEDADPAYLTQMAVYAAVLRALYPGRRVEAALLWTDGAKLTPLSDALIEARLAALNQS